MIVHSENWFVNTSACKHFVFYSHSESHAIIEEVKLLYDNDDSIVGYVHKELSRHVTMYLNATLASHLKDGARTYSTTLHFNAAIQELKTKVQDLSLFDGAMAL